MDADWGISVAMGTSGLEGTSSSFSSSLLFRQAAFGFKFLSGQTLKKNINKSGDQTFIGHHKAM